MYEIAIYINGLHEQGPGVRLCSLALVMYNPVGAGVVDKRLVLEIDTGRQVGRVAGSGRLVPSPTTKT